MLSTQISEPDFRANGSAALLVWSSGIFLYLVPALTGAFLLLMSLVTYVWFDALLSYYTAAGYEMTAQKRAAMRKRWPARCMLSAGHHPFPCVIGLQYGPW